MRYIFAVLISCAIAAPASAAQKAGASQQTAARASATAKQTRAPDHRQSRDTGGIHPLVGSGEY
jgi:hypothetical protein